MNWNEYISNKEVEAIRYAINYDLDEEEKKLIALSKNHDTLIRFILTPFNKFGYAEELRPVRKYYRMNYLQENKYAKISSLLDWDSKNLKIQERFHYFIQNFLAKDTMQMKAFFSYFLFMTLICFAIIFNDIKEIDPTNENILKVALFISCISIMNIIFSLGCIFFFPTLAFYNKGIFRDIYGDSVKQEETKNMALNTITKITGLTPTIKKNNKNYNFIEKIEILSKEYQNNINKKQKNPNPFINFCEEAYEQSSKISKTDYSYEELLQKNNKKLILDKKESLENLLPKDKPTRTKKVKI